MHTIFVYTIFRGEALDVVAASADIVKLRKRMKKDIQDFITGVYGDNEEVLEWLQPIDSNPNFWSDEDGEYPTEFHIFETELM